MRLYFQSRANFCSFKGSPGLHHARTAAHDSTHIREMRATTPPWIPGLWVIEHRTPFGPNVRGSEVTAPRTRHTQTTLVSKIEARIQHSPGALYEHSNKPPNTCSERYVTQSVTNTHFTLRYRIERNSLLSLIQWGKIHSIPIPPNSVHQCEMGITSRKHQLCWWFHGGNQCQLGSREGSKIDIVDYFFLLFRCLPKHCI